MPIEVLSDTEIDLHIAVGPNFDAEMLEAELFDNYASFQTSGAVITTYHATTGPWRAALQAVCDAHDPETAMTQNFDACEQAYLEAFMANWREELVLLNVLNINRLKIEALDRIVTKFNSF